MGTYTAEEWTREHQSELEEIDRLRDEGHTHHCACRIIWGDGECSCSHLKPDGE